MVTLWRCERREDVKKQTAGPLSALALEKVKNNPKPTIVCRIFWRQGNVICHKVLCNFFSYHFGPMRPLTQKHLPGDVN